jgi:signal transduction histidine kinase/DNA-binding response OmpR family regulator
MKINTLGARIIAGFLSILAIFVLAVLVSVFQIREVDQLSKQLKALRAPTVVASAEVLNGVNASLAALRGWVILGDKKFVVARNQSWRAIDANIDKLQTYAKHWTNPENTQRLHNVTEKLTQFKTYQIEIEHIAHAKNNRKGLEILLTHAAPLANKVITNITKLIDTEKDQAASPARKQLLSAMADFRGSFSLGLANIRAFLLSGDEQYSTNFQRYWQINTKSLQQMQVKSHMLTALQKRFFEELKDYRNSFKALPKRMLDIRRSKHWNQANELLRTKAAPIATQITKTLRKMTSNQQLLMATDFKAQESELTALMILEWILLALSILATIILAYFIVRSILKPIRHAIDAADKISQGDYSTSQKIKGFAEAEQLGKAFSQMREQVEHQINTRTKALEQQNWVKSHGAEISETLSQQDSIETLAEYVLSTLARVLKAHCAVFYIHERALDNNADIALTLSATYGYKKRKTSNPVIALGEGLVGQCAKEKKAIILTKVPKGYIPINSGLGEKSPKNLYLMPVLFNERLLGVIEIASLNKFSHFGIELLEQTAKTIGINLYNIFSVEATQKALKQSQTLAEELKAQQEELKTSNDELEEKTKILKESENELKTQSEELKTNNEELEEKGRSLEEQKKSIENKNSELEIARKAIEEKARELEKSGAYKSEFLANMSHELRTPLNSLLILSKSLADNDEGNLTKEQMEECLIIYNGGQELLALINDILDLSKVEAGKMELLLEDIPLENITTHLQSQFKPVAEKNGLTFNTLITDDLPKLMHADDQKIQQVLKNFLSNAFKFTKSGSVTLNLHKPAASQQFINTQLTADTTIAFSVTDTGIGIPKDKQQDIFEAFQQADGATNREFGGTGLGLTISRQLAALMGGEIMLESQENKGTTFTLYLPLHLAESNIEPQSEPPKNDAPPAEKKQTPVSIDLNQDDDKPWIPDNRDAIDSDSNSLLIIEDDEQFAKILMKEGRSHGFLCLAAEYGRRGLRLALKYKPSAILLDLGLPDMKGEQVLAELKQHLNTRHIPVHIISAADKSSKLMESGAIGFLQKPAIKEDLQTVFQSIERFLKKEIKHLLIIEDDLSSQRAIQKLVQNKQLEIFTAGTGEQAKAILLEKTIDSIILDLNLPDMSGFDWLKMITEEKISLPPVVVYTGKELTDKEYSQLRTFTSSIVIKGADSPERLLDEVSLFLHSIDAELPEEQQQITKALHAPEKNLAGRHVLLVDDDMRNLFALSKVLKKHDLNVEIAKDGQFALQLLAEKKEIELVIMDIMMPIMDGYEAIQKIRAQKELKKLPIIALTAKAMPEDRQKCIDVGANDYLAKPVDVDRLLSLMRVWLGKA